MITVYQNNTFDVELPRNSVDLVITSPSRDTLLNDATRLFAWLDECIAKAGVLFIDLPGQYGETVIPMWEGERCSSWKFQWGFPFHDFYQAGDTASICAYARDYNTVPRPKDLSYHRYTEREMTHQCEWDALLVSNLIETFSEPGQSVLDPFCGTGTVPRVAHSLGRHGIGIDQRCPFTNKLPEKIK